VDRKPFGLADNRQGDHRRGFKYKTHE
jgi:hypothetical protein